MLAPADPEQAGRLPRKDPAWAPARGRGPRLARPWQGRWTPGFPSRRFFPAHGGGCELQQVLPGRRLRGAGQPALCAGSRLEGSSRCLPRPRHDGIQVPVWFFSRPLKSPVSQAEARPWHRRVGRVASEQRTAMAEHPTRLHWRLWGRFWNQCVMGCSGLSREGH